MANSLGPHEFQLLLKRSALNFFLCDLLLHYTHHRIRDWFDFVVWGNIWVVRRLSKLPAISVFLYLLLNAFLLRDEIALVTETVDIGWLGSNFNSVESINQLLCFAHWWDDSSRFRLILLDFSWFDRSMRLADCSDALGLGNGFSQGESLTDLGDNVFIEVVFLYDFFQAFFVGDCLITQEWVGSCSHSTKVLTRYRVMSAHTVTFRLQGVNCAT